MNNKSFDSTDDEDDDDLLINFKISRE